jgi:hypothetical protein
LFFVARQAGLVERRGCLVERRAGLMAICASYISPQSLASGDNNNCPLRGCVDSLPALTPVTQSAGGVHTGCNGSRHGRATWGAVGIWGVFNAAWSMCVKVAGLRSLFFCALCTRKIAENEPCNVSPNRPAQSCSFY